MASAWSTVALGRARKLKPLSTYLVRRNSAPPPPPTAAEQAQVIDAADRFREQLIARKG